MEIKEIENLAARAKIDIDTDEIKELALDFDKIFDYVSQINESGITDTENDDINIKNVFRDDVVTNKNGEFTDAIVTEMPDKKDGYLKVKKIL